MSSRIGTDSDPSRRICDKPTHITYVVPHKLLSYLIDNWSSCPVMIEINIEDILPRLLACLLPHPHVNLADSHALRSSL